MGTKYAGIVETCLTCLDPDNADFGDEREFEDADGIRVGARYIEKVSRTGSTLISQGFIRADDLGSAASEPAICLGPCIPAQRSIRIEAL